ncbi:MAG: 4-hydroxy-3-methylbut-2-enyl diphosphate reductase [Planctomycetes bacterium RBG_16_59_8]|nr:MAG: 4-hydroxy-3-methylbut-2-enyl diphosphate reductase [Planctomycetes bacterium RBG_16_59_8]
MEIKIAREIGYCYGVRDAIEAVIEEAESADGKRKVYTFGPIIHNRQTVEELESKHGIVTANTPEEIEEASTVVIRTHGIPLSSAEKLTSRQLKVVDATCPFVQKTQVRAKKFVDEGYYLVILGKKQHPEVISIAGVAEHCTIVEHEEDIEDVPRKPKIAVVFQSTVAFEDFRWALPALADHCYELNVLKTICGVTITRQKRTEEIAREVELMVIIGGKNSSNTKKLVDISKRHCAKTHHIEGPDELDAIDFTGVKVVGIGSGTSTPQSLVDEVVEKLHAIAIVGGEPCPASGAR